jgi:hypothetical protein
VLSDAAFVIPFRRSLGELMSYRAPRELQLVARARTSSLLIEMATIQSILDVGSPPTPPTIAEVRAA